MNESLYGNMLERLATELDLSCADAHTLMSFGCVQIDGLPVVLKHIDDPARNSVVFRTSVLDVNIDTPDEIFRVLLALNAQALDDGLVFAVDDELDCVTVNMTVPVDLLTEHGVLRETLVELAAEAKEVRVLLKNQVDRFQDVFVEGIASTSLSHQTKGE